MAKKNSVVNLKFSGNGYIVKIKEDNEAYLYAYKDGDELHMAIIINVYNKEEKHICTYGKAWMNDKKYSPNILNSFIKNFLEDVEFRKDVDLISGKEGWSGTIPFTNNNGVNIKCKEAIDSLNKKRNPNFSDFAEVRTHGLDIFSRMKYEKLIENISEEDLGKIKGKFEDENLILRTLRWMRRGLSVHYAIRKTLTDLEVGENANKRKATGQKYS